MPAIARAHLESLLRARKLDRTLTSALPHPAPADDQATAATGIGRLDARLSGGFPRGQLSEIVGPASSGRTTIVTSTLAAATGRGELVAVIDALDMLDVPSFAAAGVDLDRLLWIRGFVVTSPGMCRDLNQRAVEQAIRALSLVLQAGNFGVVVLDAAGAPADALRRLPFTTWLRLQRMVEGTQTTCVLVGDRPMARSSAGLTVVTSRDASSAGSSIEGERTRADRQPVVNRGSSRLFKGIDLEVRVVQARHAPRISNSEFRIPHCPDSHVRLHLHAVV